MSNLKIIHFNEIDSTSKYLKEHSDLPSFTFVCADYQTAGKGREDRRWLSNEKENLLFSFIIKDKNIIDDYSSLSIISAYIIAKFLIDLGIKDVSIKWPNDVFVGDKKICGILLEGQLPNYIVVGIGLNVNQMIFSNDLHYPATSIALLKNKRYDINLLRDQLFELIYSSLNNFLKTKVDMNIFIKKHNYLLNKFVEINGVNGIVIDIENNNLIVCSKEKTYSFSSGEIKIK